MPFHISDLLAAVALIFVLEGMIVFVSPRGTKRTAEKLLLIGDRELRIAGLGSMLVGVAVLFIVR